MWSRRGADSQPARNPRPLSRSRRDVRRSPPPGVPLPPPLPEGADVERERFLRPPPSPTAPAAVGCCSATVVVVSSSGLLLLLIFSRHPLPFLLLLLLVLLLLFLLVLFSFYRRLRPCAQTRFRIFLMISETL